LKEFEMSGGDWKDMYQAAVAGDLARVQYHLKQGVNPNYLHPEVMCTPLVASLIHGHSAIAHHLLAHGADPNLLSDYDGLTPLQAAQQYGRAEFIQRLSEAAPTQPANNFWRKLLPF
jgi:uncharacterized protein